MTHDFQRSYYADLIAKHGNRRGAAGWGSQESQERRFAVFNRHWPLSNRRLIDIGCGRGDLLSYLKAIGSKPASYTGVDIMSDVIEYGRTNHPDANFCVGDILDGESTLEQADFVLCSGVFNLIGPDHERWIADLAAAMFCLAREGSAFNVISRFAPEHKSNHYYADPVKMLALAQSITPYVTLQHDYAVHDMTIFMSRQPNDI